MAYFSFNCKNKSVPKIIEWCNAEFGKGNWRLLSAFPSTYWQFELPTPEAEHWFKLRWR